MVEIHPHSSLCDLPDKPSIAVLPFTNMSGDPKEEYFSDGITEEIITALSKVPYLFVIARNSTFTYKGKPVKVKQVSEELGVRYVLEGSVRRAGSRVRITAQLIHAATDTHLWSGSFEREIGDVMALQGTIARAIAADLRLNLGPEEQGRASRKRRVARGSGTTVQEVNQLLAQFRQMQRMMKRFKKGHFRKAFNNIQFPVN
jgi:adenylate cyclase